MSQIIHAFSFKRICSGCLLIATGKKLQQLSTKSGGPEFAEAEEGEANQPTIQSQRSGKIWSPGTGKKVNTECCVLNLKGPPQALF